MLIAIILLYLAFLVFIVMRGKKPETVDQYLIGGRDASSFRVGSSLFTLIGAGEFVTLTSLGYLFGWSAIALFVGYSLGFILLGLLASRMRSEAEDRQYVSLPDYITDKFGNGAGRLVLLFSVLAFFALLMLQFSAVGAVISPIVDQPRGLIIAVTGFVVLCYLHFGGFKAVLTTDVVQAIAMFVLLPVVLFFIVSSSDVSLNFRSGTEGVLPNSLWISLVVTGLLVASASADVWQRVYAAKSDASARLGFFGGAIAFIIIGFVSVGFGTIASGMGLESPDNAFVELLTNHLPEALGAMVALLILSALMSTADTEIFLLTGLIKKELDRFKGGKYKVKTLSGVKYLMVSIGVLSLLFAYFFSDLVGIYSWLLSIIIIVSPAVIGSLLVKTSRLAVLSSIIVGVFVLAMGLLSERVTLDNLYLIVIPGIVLFLFFTFIESLKSNG